MVEFFPKRLQNRARLLFHSIKNYIKIDDDNRVIYSAQDGAEYRGSSLIVLTHYLIMPMPLTKIQARPFDLMDFAKLIAAAAIPSNAYGSSKQAIVDALRANENMEQSKEKE